MAKRQSRRSVSLNRRLFDDAKLAAARAGISLSKYTELALAVAMNADDRQAARAADVEGHPA